MDGSYVLPKSGPKRVDTSLAVQATPDSASRCSTPPATSPVKPVERTQRQRIVDAVRDRDVKQLTVMAAESGGFEDSELRRSVWSVTHALHTSKIKLTHALTHIQAYSVGLRRERERQSGPNTG